MNFFLLLFVVLIVGRPAFAASDLYPRLGMVYGETENQSLSYACKKISVWTIECKFSNARVSVKSKPEDWSKRKQSMIDEYPKQNRKDVLEFCKAARLWDS